MYQKNLKRQKQFRKSLYHFPASGCNSQTCSRHFGQDEEIFDSIDFYLRRFTRILPVYYFCLFCGAIMLQLLPFNGSLNDSSVFGGDLLVSILLMQTWTNKLFWCQGIMLGYGTNEVGWTVSTLFFFYLVYPRYFLRLKW